MANRSGWKALRIGMRTVKTVLSVGITLTLFELLNRQPAVLAAISSVYSLQTDHQKSLSYGKFRIFGNTIGVIIAILVAKIGITFQLDNSAYRVFASMIGILIIIILCNAFNSSTSIMNSSATFFVVLLNTPSSHLIEYGANRVLDTIIGATIAIIVNRVLHFPDDEPDTA